MGLFNYNSPFITLMVKIANMIIVSLYWVICCLPVVTILPACTALYHSVQRVIGGNGGGVTRDFFAAFKSALKPGVALNGILLMLGILVAFGLYTGTKIWDAGLFGTVYMASGILVTITYATMLIYAPPVLSRFEGGMSVIIRLSLYFSSRNLLKSIWFVLLLYLAWWVVDLFPLLLLVMPALYADLIRPGVEKEMRRYIRESGLEDVEESEEAETVVQPEMLSQRKIDELLTQEGDREEN